MEPERAFQILIEKKIDEKDLLALASRALGFVVDSSDMPSEAAKGVAMFDDYALGFLKGMYVTWPESYSPICNELGFARHIAGRARSRVLVVSDDDRWQLVNIDGSVDNVSVVEMENGAVILVEK